jgi:hypothetical protein
MNGDSMPSEHHWGPSQIVVVIIVIVVLLILGFWLYGKTGTSLPGAGTTTRPTTEEIAPGQTLTHAAEGKIIAGFPKELLLEDGVSVSESYSIAYANDNVAQPAVHYTSHKSLAENVALFGDYFSASGWTVTQEADASATGVTSFYATRGENEEVNVTLGVIPPPENLPEGAEAPTLTDVTVLYTIRG